MSLPLLLWLLLSTGWKWIGVRDPDPVFVPVPGTAPVSVPALYSRQDPDATATKFGHWGESSSSWDDWKLPPLSLGFKVQASPDSGILPFPSCAANKGAGVLPFLTGANSIAKAPDVLESFYRSRRGNCGGWSSFNAY